VVYDRAFHLANVDALVEAVGGENRITIVGHSLGGALAGLWMAQHPERPAAGALVAAPFPGGMAMPSGQRRTHDMDQRSSWQRVYRTLQTAWPLVTFPVRSRVFPHAVITDFMRHTLASYWGTAQAVLWDPAAQDEVTGLSALTAPLLLMSGAGDRNVPAETADRWASLVPAAERLAVPGGHQLLFRGGLAPLVGWLRDHAPGV
jgi:pimeloyl-ACP methyl ester carboxylesterase